MAVWGRRESDAGVVVAEYGGPEVLRVAEVPEPEAGPGEVTISVRFAGGQLYRCP